jgi:3-phenylpropionate/trans-cinnamate dioxygenase ferredoxin subunit
MTYLLACAPTDVPVDEALGVTLGDVAVALSEGEVDDCTLECWLHGSRFDLRTGKPTGLPATEPVATFPVEVRDDGVYVDTATTLNGVKTS